MSIATLFHRIDLQLFAEGSGTGDGGATGATGEAAAPQAKGVKSNPLAAVKYGIQDEVQTADAPQTTVETPDRNAEFERLIKGEYKDLYDARMQETIQKRLKGTRETVEKYEALAPTLEMLGKKYGVNAEDIAALNKAIEEDDSYYEDEASRKMTPTMRMKPLRRVSRLSSSRKSAEWNERTLTSNGR